MQKFVGMMILWLLVACSTEPTMRPIYVGDTTPKKTASYQVQSGGHTIGYAHKYEWETAKGIPHHQYWLYDLEGDLVGYVGEYGETQLYDDKGSTKDLGQGSLDEGAAQIFGVATAYVFPTRMYDMAEAKTITIESRLPATPKAPKPTKILEPQREDEALEQEKAQKEEATEEKVQKEEATEEKVQKEEATEEKVQKEEATEKWKEDDGWLEPR